MPATIVPLSRTYTETGRTFDRLTFRQPRWQDYVDLGDVQEWQPVDPPGTENPRMMLVRHNDVVAQYAERCIEQPASASDLAVLDLADTIAVHKAVRDFFTESASSESQQINSSGDTEKGSTKSGD